MKPFLLACLLLTGLCLSAQNVSSANKTKPDKPDTLTMKKDSVFKSAVTIFRRMLDSIYICKSDDSGARQVHSDALDTLFKPIFSTVVLDNEELVKNGSAASLAQDNNSGKVSVNYSKIPRKHPFQMYNFGIYAQSAKSIFNFYSGNSWNNGIGANFSASFLLPWNKQRFTEKDCLELTEKRERFAAEFIMKLRKEMNAYDSAEIRLIDSLQKMLTLGNVGKTDSLLSREIDLEDVQKKLELAEARQKKMGELLKRKDSAVREMLNAQLIEFDVKNAKFTGYTVRWFQVGMGFGNDNNKLYNDTLTRDSIFNFTVKDFARFNAFGKFNIALNHPRNILFFNFGVDIRNTNYLENRGLKEVPFIQYDSTAKKFFIKESEGKTLGELDRFKSNIWIWVPSIYFADFFMLGKTLGFEFKADLRLPFSQPENVDYPRMFNTSIAVLFRVKAKDDISKATIGAEAGLYDAEYHTHVWKNHFGARLKIGVPFKSIIN